MNKKLLTAPVIAVLVALAVAAIGYVTVWSPQSKQITKQESAVTAAQAELLTERVRVASLRAQAADVGAAQAKLTQLKLAIPDKVAQDQVIDQLNAVAVAAGVDLQSVATTRAAAAVGAATTASGAEVIGIPMAVSGTYPQVIDFVNRLNAMTHLVVVDSLNVTAAVPAAATAAVTAAEPVFTVQVSARTFYANAG